MPPDIPAGYVPFTASMGFIDHVGPLYWIPDKERFRMAFRVEARHVNPARIAHGGMLLTVADMTLTLGTHVVAEVNAFLPTVHMDCEFLAPARLGDWVAGRVHISRATQRMAFAACTLEVEGSAVLRASGIMMIPRPDDERFQIDPRLLERRKDGA
jgi:acyl-coenzyme A thioesterase PaaI-like protein